MGGGIMREGVSEAQETKGLSAREREERGREERGVSAVFEGSSLFFSSFLLEISSS